MEPSLLDLARAPDRLSWTIHLVDMSVTLTGRYGAAGEPGVQTSVQLSC